MSSKSDKIWLKVSRKHVIKQNRTEGTTGLVDGEWIHTEANMMDHARISRSRNLG